MMFRDYEELFPLLEELGIGLVAFSPLSNGLLSGSYTAESTFTSPADKRSTMPQYQKESFETNKELFALLSELSTKHSCTSSQIALAWMLCKKPYIVPIPGSRKLSRVQENFGAASVKLSHDEVSAIDSTLNHIHISGVYGVRK